MAAEIVGPSASTGGPPGASAEDATAATSAEYYARRRRRSAKTDSTLAIIWAASARVQEMRERTGVAILNGEVQVNPYATYVRDGAREHRLWLMSLDTTGLFGKLLAEDERWATVNATFTRLGKIAGWMRRFRAVVSPAEAAALIARDRRDIDSVRRDPEQRGLKESLEIAERASERRSLHEGPLTQMGTRSVSYPHGTLEGAMQVRSAALHLGQTVVDTPMRAPGLPQGAGHPRNVAFIAFYRGVYVFYQLHGLGRPTSTDVADLSIYWQLEPAEEVPNPKDEMLTPTEKRTKRINNWKARLSEPWAQEVRADVAELLRPTAEDDPDVGPDLWATAE